jgi:hypothetical protein
MSAWSAPDVGTATCSDCGADITDKAAEWVVVTPAGAWCSHHVKSAPQ